MKKYLLIVCLICFTISGCSSKFAYNNIDWLMYWYIDEYVDLDKQQKTSLDPKVQQWLAWHRSEQLAQYRAQLQILKQQISTGAVTPGQWLTHMELAKQHWASLRDEISPALVSLVPQLSDKQIISFFDTLEEKNRERIKEREEKKPQQRWVKQVEDIEQQAKGFIGKLTPQQKKLIEDYTQRFESNFENWINYRRNIQRDARTLMLQRRDDMDFKTKLIDLMRHPENYQDAAFRQKSAQNSQLYSELLAALSQSLTEKQRRKGIKELQDMIDDITDLIAY
ncbi:MAG: hypothetical protein ACJA13_001809 [Paraglaciecola sp.]|jgi:hypothetical protein